MCLYLFHFVILSQQSIRTVGDTHGDDAHGAYHHHGNIDVREHRHDSSSFEGESRQIVTNLLFWLVGGGTITPQLVPIENPSVPMM